MHIIKYISSNYKALIKMAKFDRFQLKALKILLFDRFKIIYKK